MTVFLFLFIFIGLDYGRTDRDDFSMVVAFNR